MKKKFKDLCKKIWLECKDRQTLMIFFIVVLVMYSPVWLCYLLYFIFKYNTFLVVATACLAFWAGPFTPFFPICIGITLAIKKILKKKNGVVVQHEIEMVEQSQCEDSEIVNSEIQSNEIETVHCESGEGKVV